MQGLEDELDRETVFLIRHGWSWTGDYWMSPAGEACFGLADVACRRDLLARRGWRTFTEVRHDRRGVTRWLRWQSPSGRCYGYAGAASVIESGWVEAEPADSVGALLTELLGLDWRGAEAHTRLAGKVLELEVS